MEEESNWSHLPYWQQGPRAVCARLVQLSVFRRPVRLSEYLNTVYSIN